MKNDMKDGNIIDNPLSENPLRSKSDLQEAVKQLCQPLKSYFSHGCAHLRFGYSGAQYSGNAATMEAYARLLWGLVPMSAGGGHSELWEIYLEGLKNGTNPEHPEYWKKYKEDQLLVEMSAVSLGLSLVPEKLWDPLMESEKNNVVKWLNQINHSWTPDSNWKMFIVMVNMTLKKLGAAYDSEAMEKALERVEDFYLGNGWYSDGKGEQRDYYIPFALHFYSLIYSKIMEKDDPKRSELFKARAVEFAKDFIHWFAEDGSAIPFGRSLTYRFAQSAFWGALAFAGVEAFPWGVIKGIVLRNLRWWAKMPIFQTGGILSIGYAYPNLVMAEGYNAPGSPYWAMKAFLPLALPDTHPFWTAKEEVLPELKPEAVLKHPHMIICRTKEDGHVYSLTSGQFCTLHLSHSSAKYEKFAYSTLFAFSVPKAGYGLSQGAYDSMLALCEKGEQLYRVRSSCEEYRVETRLVYSRWKPWQDVEIKTWLIPAGSWHIRIHRMETKRAVNTAEGGFAIKREERNFLYENAQELTQKNGGAAVLPWGTSGIVDLSGDREATMVWPEGNTNLIHPRTVIPTLTGCFEPGTHWLTCAVLGSGQGRDADALWVAKPLMKKESNRISIIEGATKELIFSLDTEMME